MKSRKKLIKSVLLVILSLAVFILAVLAWFVLNNRVEGESSLISALSSRYAIVTGKEGDKVGIWERGSHDADFDFDTSDSMYVNSESNFKNTAETSKLAPGSFGELTFTVSPIAEDLGNIEVTIETNLKMRNDSNTDYANMNRYITGHILFFTGKTGRYYHGWIGPDDSGNYGFTIPASAFMDENSRTTADVTRTVYWVWPQQFHNYVYTGGGTYYRNVFESESDDGYSELIDDMMKNSSRYFAGDVSGVDDISSNMSGSDYDICTEGYNNADQLIGEEIEFVQVRFRTNETGGK